MIPRVHGLHEPPAEHRARLQGLVASWGPEVPAGTEVLVGGRPSDAQLVPGLRRLAIPYAGLPAGTRLRLLQRPEIAVHNLHHNADAVAEGALALLLAAAKAVVPMDRALRAGDWRPRYAPDPAIPLAGQRAGGLGHGAIGSRLARLLGALGMRVDAVSRRGQGAHPVAALPALLVGARVVVVAVPGTPATRGLLGEAELEALADPAVLVNVGRAAVVDEDALYAALRSGRLRAGLDVHYAYPADEAARASTAPSKHPLHQLDGVVLSPHRTAHGPHVEAARYGALAELLGRIAAGEEPARVDVDAGY